MYIQLQKTFTVEPPSIVDTTGQKESVLIIEVPLYTCTCIQLILMVHLFSAASLPPDYYELLELCSERE